MKKTKTLRQTLHDCIWDAHGARWRGQEQANEQELAELEEAVATHDHTLQLEEKRILLFALRRDDFSTGTSEFLIRDATAEQIREKLKTLAHVPYPDEAEVEAEEID